MADYRRQHDETRDVTNASGRIGQVTKSASWIAMGRRIG